jgi:anti-anti-sigma regulatory factor
MELNLLRSQGSEVRVVVMGRITRDGWVTTDDPLGDLYGQDVYRRTVLLNLTESLYIDSTGVEWLLICHRRFEDEGGMLIVHSVNPLSRQLLKMMGMDSR